MANDYAKGFYASAAWVKCRDGFMSSKNYICERCGEVAVICHHKKHITPANISDPNITLNWDNLEALCQACHNEVHMSKGAIVKGLRFTADGDLIQTPPPRK
jgi:5-methylcytosine-specific restriction endonuclease McrA